MAWASYLWIGGWQAVKSGERSGCAREAGCGG